MLKLPGQHVDGRLPLPLFVFPTSLAFYSDDQSSHKQVLTLYNPYETVIRFKVLCTVPRKYSVVDPEGTIRPRCCVDIVIRHNDVCIKNEGMKDKFRIHMMDNGQKVIVGKKDIVSILHPTCECPPQQDERFEALPSSCAAGHLITSSGLPDNSLQQAPDRSVSGPSFIVILTAILCIGALLLPTQGEKTKLPESLHITIHQKLIAAYILGLVTMVILRV